MAKFWSAFLVAAGYRRVSVAEEPTESCTTDGCVIVLDVACGAVLIVRVGKMATVDHLHGVTEDELVVGDREERCGDIDQDGNPAVGFVGESFRAKESSSNHSSTQISGKIGRDGNIGESDNHGRICETNHEWRSRGRDEWIGGIKDSPDDHSNEGVHEEFNEEELN